MVETGRLIIIPLDYNQLRLYMRGNGRFEKELRITNNVRNVSPEVKDNVEFFIMPAMKKAINDDHLFYTFWLVIEKISKNIVAELGFKGTPDDKGEIEIGYGAFFEHRRKGFMTEAVGGMTEWTRKRTNIKYILAETDENNLASIKVLEKNNFEVFDKKGNMIWWRKEIIPVALL